MVLTGIFYLGVPFKSGGRGVNFSGVTLTNKNNFHNPIRMDLVRNPTDMRAPGEKRRKYKIDWAQVERERAEERERRENDISDIPVQKRKEVFNRLNRRLNASDTIRETKEGDFAIYYGNMLDEFGVGTPLDSVERKIVNLVRKHSRQGDFKNSITTRTLEKLEKEYIH